MLNLFHQRPVSMLVKSIFVICSVLLLSTGKGVLSVNGQEDKTGLGRIPSLEKVIFSPDGKRILVCSGNLLKISDSNSGAELMTLSGHNSWVRDANYSFDGKRIVSASMDHSSKVWDATSGKELLNFVSKDRFNGEEVNYLSRDVNSKYFSIFSQDGKFVYSCSGRGPAKKWDSSSGKELVLYRDATDIQTARTGQRFLIVTSYTASVYEPSNELPGKSVLEYVAPSDQYVSECSLSPDGTKLAISFSLRDSKKGILKNPIVIDLSTKNQIASLENDNQYVRSIKFSYDGRKIVSVSEQSASVWDAMTGTQLRSLDVWEGSVSWLSSAEKLVKYAEFNPTGDRLVTTYGDGYGATDKAGKSVKVWDITNLKVIFSL